MKSKMIGVLLTEQEIALLDAVREHAKCANRCDTVRVALDHLAEVFCVSSNVISEARRSRGWTKPPRRKPYGPRPKQPKQATPPADLRPLVEVLGIAPDESPCSQQESAQWQSE